MIVIDYFPGLRFPFTPQMTSQFVFLAQASFLCSRGGSASCPACFPQIKFYWHIAAPIHLHLVGAPFFTYLPRGGLAYQANNAVYRKTLLTLLHTWQPDRHPALALAAPGDTFDAIISNLSSGVQLHQVPRTPSLSASHMPRRGRIRPPPPTAKGHAQAVVAPTASRPQGKPKPDPAATGLLPRGRADPVT